MNKDKVKFWIFAFGIAGLIPVGLIGFALMSSFIAAFNTGADPASIFRGHSLYAPSVDEAQWVSVEAEGTAATDVELEELISAYWLAWEALEQAHVTGDLNDLPTYWAGDALDAARRSAESGITVTHSGHRLRLVFFSDDSSVAVVRDLGFSYTVTDASGVYALTATAEIVLTLDNGFWRIRQYKVNFS